MDDVKWEQRLDEVQSDVKTVRDEVEAVETSMIRKTFMSNKAIIIQTIALVITLLGIALAAERRITTIEVNQKSEVAIREEHDQEMMQAIKNLQVATSAISENQIRVVTILDGIEKRHNLEDQRRAAQSKAND